MTSRRLEGKVAIVTGSSSGLGRHISLAYAQHGAKLVCADLQPQARSQVPSEVEKTTHELIQEQGGEAIFVQTDVGKGSAWEELVKRAVEEYGQVDILVNNAGLSIESRVKPVKIHETPDETWDVTMEVNLRSVFLGCKHVIGQMMKQEKNESGDRGWVVNMSSIFGLVGGLYNCAYGASKGAVTNLTRQVALDYGADGIHCNAICPGYTKTAIFHDTIKHLTTEEQLMAKHPLHGVGRPEDIVGAAVFLASAEARWITGVNLPVDGGYTVQ